MTQEKTQEKTGARRMGLLIAAAATALTVAAGLTAGALLGYVGPGRSDAASGRSGEIAATGNAVTNGARAEEGSPAVTAPELARGEAGLASAGVEESTFGGREGRGEHEGRERGGHHRGEHEGRERGEHERGDDDDD